MNMTQATPQAQVLEYTVPAGEDQASFPLDVDGLARNWTGWAWYRARYV